MKTECPKPPRYTFGKVWRGKEVGLAYGPIDREEDEIAPFTGEWHVDEAMSWVPRLNDGSADREDLYWEPFPEWPDKE